jgi:capsular exopolysaccharide synthesis family protein
VAEAFRALRTNLEFSAKDTPIKSLIVTSGGPGEGKTTVASNLAAILSHSGKKVILMDADLRRPRVHKYTGISNNVGLSDILSAEQKIEISDYLQTLENLPDLHLLPSGGLPANPSELLGSEKMRQLLADLSGSYDYIIIDAPPMLVSDPQVLLGLVDGVLLVLVPGKTPRDVVSAVKEQVSHTGVRLLGVVFNRLKQGKRSGYYGGYSGSYYNTYYSSSYYAQDDTEANGAVKKKGLFKNSKKRA